MHKMSTKVMMNDAIILHYVL